MDLFTKSINQMIQENIIKNIELKNYEETSKNIIEIFKVLYDNIPNNKRISYGTYYIMKVLSKNIYDQLLKEKIEAFSSLTDLIKLQPDFRGKCIFLGILSLYAIDDIRYIKKVLPLFSQFAIDDNWIVRETTAGFFHNMIKHHPNRMKSYLHDFSLDKNPKLRRFASESLRPVAENKWIQKNPEYSLSILRNMFNESTPYPRTSVGNNLSDLARKNPDLIFSIVKNLVESKDKNSYWIAYRACRNLVKKEPLKVMNLLNVDEYKYKKYQVKREHIHENL